MEMEVEESQVRIPSTVGPGSCSPTHTLNRKQPSLPVE